MLPHTGLEIGSFAELISAFSGLGALVAAMVAVWWAARAAREANKQALSAELQVAVAQRELKETRAANSVPVLIDLFTEHRGDHLAQAREFVFNELPNRSTPNGLKDLTLDERKFVRDLLFFYGNVGILVAHGVIDVDPVCAYLGGSVQTVWAKVEKQIIEPERSRRKQSPDITAWQAYFENLAILAARYTAEELENSAPHWVLPRHLSQPKAVDDAHNFDANGGSAKASLTEGASEATIVGST